MTKNLLVIEEVFVGIINYLSGFLDCRNFAIGFLFLGSSLHFSS